MQLSIQSIRAAGIIGWIAGLLLVSVAQAAPSTSRGSVVGPLFAEALKGPLRDVDEILFAVNHFARGGFGDLSPGREERRNQSVECGQLCKLNLRTGKVVVLLDDPGGDVRDCSVHYDGKKALFTYRKGGADSHHVFEINLDGTGLTRLTPDDGHADGDPTYLPNGDIVFTSTRANRVVACASCYSVGLFRCRADGSNPVQISYGLEDERDPSVLPDGRIVFARWDYYHRGTHGWHPMMTMNPDGTGQAAFFGNNTLPNGWPGHPRGIPGAGKVVYCDSHDAMIGGPWRTGNISIFDPAAGPDNRGAIKKLGARGIDPYPLTENLIPVGSEDKLVLLDGKRCETLYSLDAPCAKGKWLTSPWPVRSRPREPIVPDRVDRSVTTGKFMLMDVTRGQNMAGVEPGAVKRLLVLEYLHTPDGPYWPSQQQRAPFFLNRILGTVPVEADGSAYFEAPAMRSLAFAPLDERGLALKHMQSATGVMPGETIGCVGCHERRTDTGASVSLPLAMRRAPSRIEPFEGLPDRLGYEEDIQLIWDRHCVTCHNPDKREGGVLMTRDRGGDGRFHSHLSLIATGQAVDCRPPNLWGNLPPRRMGSAASPLMRKLDGSHHDVKVSPREWAAVQLWLDTMIPYHKYYGEKIEAGGKGIGKSLEEIVERRCYGCHEKNKKRKGRMDADMYPGFRAAEDGCNILFYKEPSPSQEMDEPRNRPRNEADYERDFKESFSRNENQLRRGASILINKTRPEKSLVLLAPLAKSAGGYATESVEAVKAGKVKAMPVLFQSTDDPDYRAMLAAIPRWTEQPRRATLRGGSIHARYVLYGLLPPESKPTDSLDYREMMDRYWESHVWKPAVDRGR